MKKFFIVIGTIFILISCFYYYDKNIRYGEPTLVKVLDLNDGHFYDNAKFEKKVVYGKTKEGFGLYDVIISESNDSIQSLDSYNKKLEHYKLNTNGAVSYSDVEIPGGTMFVVDYGDKGSFFVVHHNTINAEITSKIDAESTKSFIKWLIRYQL